MNKKNIGLKLLLGILLLLLIGAFKFQTKQKDDPYEAVVKHFPGTISNLAPADLVYQTDFSNKECIVFYVTKNDTLSCAVVKEKFLSYDVIALDNELPLTSSKENGKTMLFSYDSGSKWVQFGVIPDSPSHEVEIDHHKANIVPMKDRNLNLFYLNGEADTAITSPFEANVK